MVLCNTTSEKSFKINTIAWITSGKAVNAFCLFVCLFVSDIVYVVTFMHVTFVLPHGDIRSAVGPPNLGRAQAPYSSLSFCLLGKK